MAEWTEVPEFFEIEGRLLSQAEIESTFGVSIQVIYRRMVQKCCDLIVAVSAPYNRPSKPEIKNIYNDRTIRKLSFLRKVKNGYEWKWEVVCNKDTRHVCNLSLSAIKRSSCSCHRFVAKDRIGEEFGNHKIVGVALQGKYWVECMDCGVRKRSPLSYTDFKANPVSRCCFSSDSRIGEQWHRFEIVERTPRWTYIARCLGCGWESKGRPYAVIKDGLRCLNSECSGYKGKSSREEVALNRVGKTYQGLVFVEYLGAGFYKAVCKKGHEREIKFSKKVGVCRECVKLEKSNA